MARIVEVIRKTPSVGTFVLDGEMGAQPVRCVMLWLPSLEGKPVRDVEALWAHLRMDDGTATKLLARVQSPPNSMPISPSLTPASNGPWAMRRRSPT
ncbi:MAG: hypothetical protein CUN48_02475 [Candidatus Thermofonsia Clade 3 bacterium]|uniref:Uncharacterized protein n=1 Tax=Candidatus Thermofonsia Clade 3 bacterium TaxID=2364212 RepID=A0A2M8QFS5_9CHLR|nr:MAG: hypothetical protein CUN48_02475 [Candidatus Thermofonsia Clade 3 bacterium]